MVFLCRIKVNIVLCNMQCKNNIEYTWIFYVTKEGGKYHLLFRRGNDPGNDILIIRSVSDWRRMDTKMKSILALLLLLFVGSIFARPGVWSQVWLHLSVCDWIFKMFIYFVRHLCITKHNYPVYLEGNALVFNSIMTMLNSTEGKTAKIYDKLLTCV